MKISEIDELFEKCWKGYEKKGMKTMFGKRVPNCVKKESEEHNDIVERKYVKKSYTSVDQSMYDTPKGGGDEEYKGDKRNPNFSIQHQLRKAVNLDGTHDVYFGNGDVVKVDRNTAISVLKKLDRIEKPLQKLKAIEMIQASHENMMQFITTNEDLRAWFGKGKKGGAGGGGWDRYNTKGERIGKCGDSKPGEGKPKCLSKSRAASLRASGGKKAIANAVKRKKANDPNQNRRGKAKNVNSHPKK